jgi:prepilin peptidase CpaA
VSLPAISAAVLGAAAMLTDLRSRQVPNWIPASALVAGLGWHAWSGGWRGLGMSAAGVVCGFVAFLVFYVLGGMGGGDVKLTAGFGALLGVPALFQAVLWIALLGGIWALTTLGWRALNKKQGDETIPYAPAIVAGVWLTMWARA